MADREDTLLENRAAKLERIRANGLDAYPARFHRSYKAAAATALFAVFRSAARRVAKEDKLRLSPAT